MPVTIELPPNLEEALRRDVAGFDRVAKQSLLVELYRDERITKHQLAAALGIDRFEANEVLNRFDVREDLPTIEAIERQVAAMQSRLKR